MASKKHIEDPETIYTLNHIGARKLTHVGALLQVWENKTKEEGLSLTFTEWVAKDEFVETTKRDIHALKKKREEEEEEEEEEKKKKVAGPSEEDIATLKKELVGAREEDIATLKKELVGARVEEIAALRKELVGTREGLADIATLKKELVGAREGLADIAALRKELVGAREGLAEGKKDISRLLEANKDLHEKYDELKKTICTPVPTSAADSLNGIKGILCKFNKENPVAVANGDPRGVKFGTHVSITCVDSLSVFLATAHARTLGLQSNILEKFKVFVLEGKLVTLSNEYRDGVGFSFLWKKKRGLTSVAVGWKTALAKKYDPRLGIDPVTGVNYIDPETGNMWVPDVPASAVPTKKKQKQKQKGKGKKRSLEKLSSQPEKKAKEGGASLEDEESEVFI